MNNYLIPYPKHQIQRANNQELLIGFVRGIDDFLNTLSALEVWLEFYLTQVAPVIVLTSAIDLAIQFVEWLELPANKEEELTQWLLYRFQTLFQS